MCVCVYECVCVPHAHTTQTHTHRTYREKSQTTHARTYTHSTRTHIHTRNTAWDSAARRAPQMSDLVHTQKHNVEIRELYLGRQAKPTFTCTGPSDRAAEAMRDYQRV